jgi:hypothetical protein
MATDEVHVNARASLVGRARERAAVPEISRSMRAVKSG